VITFNKTSNIQAAYTEK